MKNILGHLFYGNVSEIERSVRDLKETDTYRQYAAAYDKMREALDEEQKNLFNDFDSKEMSYLLLEKQRAYENGVKVGICLALELIDFDPKTGF